MMTERTKRTLYWFMLIGGSLMFLVFIGLDLWASTTNHPELDDWFNVGIICSMAFEMLAVSVAPITQNEINNGGKWTFYCILILTLAMLINIFDIENFTPAIVAVLAVGVVVLLIDCLLAYKWMQKVKALQKEQEELENQ